MLVMVDAGAGALICLGGLIFAGIRMMSGRFQDAIPGLYGALFGTGDLGLGRGLDRSCSLLIWASFTAGPRRASSRAALSATYLTETPYGKRWIFQDVHSGGAASDAGIEPGSFLLSVDDRDDIVPPEHPVFPMGTQSEVQIVGNDDIQRTVFVEVAQQP